jgi:hypothetical protein
MARSKTLFSAKTDTNQIPVEADGAGIISGGGAAAGACSTDSLVGFSGRLAVTTTGSPVGSRAPCCGSTETHAVIDMAKVIIRKGMIFLIIHLCFRNHANYMPYMMIYFVVVVLF